MVPRPPLRNARCGRREQNGRGARMAALNSVKLILLDMVGIFDLANGILRLIYPSDFFYAAQEMQTKAASMLLIIKFHSHYNHIDPHQSYAQRVARFQCTPCSGKAAGHQPLWLALAVLRLITSSNLVGARAGIQKASVRAAFFCC